MTREGDYAAPPKKYVPLALLNILPRSIPRGIRFGGWGLCIEGRDKGRCAQSQESLFFPPLHTSVHNLCLIPHCLSTIAPCLAFHTPSCEPCPVGVWHYLRGHCLPLQTECLQKYMKQWGSGLSWITPFALLTLECGGTASGQQQQQVFSTWLLHSHALPNAVGRREIHICVLQMVPGGRQLSKIGQWKITRHRP